MGFDQEMRMHWTRCKPLRGIAAGFITLGISLLVNVSGAVGHGHDSPPGSLGVENVVAAVDSTEQLLPAVADLSGETSPEAVFLEDAGEAILLAEGEWLADAQAQRVIAEKDELTEEYDPWEPFNDKTFLFNRKVDRYVLKPVATAYDVVVPDVVKESLRNALTNVGVVRRVVNNVLQLNFPGAGREVSRFMINSTLGVGGFFDVAKVWFGIEKSERDTGQTLGAYGVGEGPYLILPLLPPLTVRDGVGFVVDIALDPLVYFAPFAALAGRTGATVVSDRSLNLEFYNNVEEATLDLYSAVRNAYLQQRAKAIEEARSTVKTPWSLAGRTSPALPLTERELLSRIITDRYPE
jgi:phospholipid-binding lipoprotein MlaA